MLIPTSENTKNVTEMREKTLELLADVNKYGVIYIMQRSDPKAVMLSIDEFKRMYEMIEDYLDELDAKQLSQEPRGRGILHEDILKSYAKSKKL